MLAVSMLRERTMQTGTICVCIAAGGLTLDEHTQHQEAKVSSCCCRLKGTKKSRRPKLTYDTLKQPAGIPDVYHNFPSTFRGSVAHGKGQELSKIRKLLELYKRWNDRVYPHAAFDKFIADTEELSKSSVVKLDLHEMRENLIKVRVNEGDRIASDDLDGGLVVCMGSGWKLLGMVVMVQCPTHQPPYFPWIYSVLIELWASRHEYYML